LCVSKGVCGNVAPSLFSGDVPEAAVSSGEGKNKIQALKPTPSLLRLCVHGWLAEHHHPPMLHPFTA